MQAAHNVLAPSLEEDCRRGGQGKLLPRAPPQETTRRRPILHLPQNKKKGVYAVMSVCSVFWLFGNTSQLRYYSLLMIWFTRYRYFMFMFLSIVFLTQNPKIVGDLSFTFILSIAYFLL